jgi:polysaccharide biosynthesis/export protein
MIKRLLPFLLVLVTFSSCKFLYPNYLLRDTKDFYYIELKEVEYKKQEILPDDELSFGLTTLDGFELLDVVSGKAGGLTGGEGAATFLVKEDGYVELPLLGEVYVKGMTRQDLENFLEKKYSAWYNEPFIQLTVTNHRVYVFMGVGSARVLSLPAENTKLIEVLALMGGISRDSKSSKIKIIRGDYDSPMIKRIDLSTIAGLKDADFIVLPDDLIIVDPKLRPVQQTITEITYMLTILSTISTIYLLVLSITRL